MAKEFIPFKGEEILWQGKPIKKLYMLKRLSEFLEPVILFLLACLVFFFLYLLDKYDPTWPGIYLVLIVTIGVGLLKLADKTRDYQAITYYITSWRVVIHNKNSINPLKNINRQSITNIDVQVSKAEKEENAGTIFIYTDEVIQYEDHQEQVYYLLEAVFDPEEVLRIL